MSIKYALKTSVTLILIFFLLNLVHYQSDQNAPLARIRQWSVGRGIEGPARFHSNVCRGQGGLSYEIFWSGNVGQPAGFYREFLPWLLSTTAVRNQALCLINRVGSIAPEARDAAWRRSLAMNRDEDLRLERRTQWQATLSMPGSARKGLCHRTH